jgi:hypothetical protein
MYVGSLETDQTMTQFGILNQFCVGTETYGFCYQTSIIAKLCHFSPRVQFREFFVNKLR